MGNVTRSCLVCGYSGSAYESKEEWKEITVCPKCNGAFVDLFFIHKYRDNNWEPNKEIQKEVNEKEINKAAELIKGALINNNLLIISLENESSVPKVFYKGEQIGNLRELQLDWDADTNVSMGGLTYAIEHQEAGNKLPTVNRIEREVKGHAL